MKTLLTVILATCAALATASAEACDQWHGGLPWFAYGYSGSLYGLGYVPVPPYFALHPPVQYSHPVAYPYGRSPFAARFEEPRLVVETLRPRAVVNPFLAPTGQPTTAEAHPPRIITNPYYKPESPAPTSAARPAEIAPSAVPPEGAAPAAKN